MDIPCRNALIVAWGGGWMFICSCNSVIANPDILSLITLFFSLDDDALVPLSHNDSETYINASFISVRFLFRCMHLE